MYVHVYMYVYIYPHTQKEQKNICHTYMTYIYVHDMYVCTHTHGCLSCVSARKKATCYLSYAYHTHTHTPVMCHALYRCDGVWLREKTHSIVREHILQM